MGVKCGRCGKEWERDTINQGLRSIQLVKSEERPPWVDQLLGPSPDEIRVFRCPEDGHPLVLIWQGFVYSLVLDHGTTTWQY